MIGSLTPPRLGAWMGEALKVPDPAGRTWSARPGVLADLFEAVPELEKKL